jgi:hypothetical protein
MSLIFATQLTAMATAVLAVFAIVTGIYAVRAFRKQSQEVSDQAEMLRIQSEQLAEQRKVNAEQIRVLALQAAELRESLEERKREAEQLRSAQASRVWIALTAADYKSMVSDAAKAPRLDVTVVNSSEQPLYDAELHWYSASESHDAPSVQPLGTVLPGEKVRRDSPFPPRAVMFHCSAVLTFRDASGVNWARTADGALMHADSDLGPDTVRALLVMSRNSTSPPTNSA